MADDSGNMEPLFDSNLPELLAVDLAESFEIFNSRHLTAGAPAPGLMDDGSQRCSSLQQRRSLAPGLSSQVPDVLSGLHSLSAAGQKYSQLFAPELELQRRDSFSDSDSSEFSMTNLEPPPFRYRNESAATAPTSLGSDRHPSPTTSYETASPIEKRVGKSWMDLEMDDSPAQERRHSLSDISSPHHHHHHHHLSPSNNVDEVRTMSLNSRAAVPDTSEPFPELRPSTGYLNNNKALPDPPSFEQRATQPTDFPARRSSLKHRDYPIPPKLKIQPREPLYLCTPKRSSSYGTATPHATSPAVDCRPKTACSATSDFTFRERSMDTMRSNSRQVRLPTGMPSPLTDISQSEAARTGIVSFGVNVSRWLEVTVDDMPINRQDSGDTHFTTPAIPATLPVDVIESLRVTVHSFPDIMLNCSSVTMDAIRSRSRRLRHKKAPLAAEETEASSPQEQAPLKQPWWKWPTKNSPKNASFSLNQKRDAHSALSDGSNDIIGPDGSFGAYRAEWMCIKNIFPHGTDYLCDALYAHIVAFNYITSICTRTIIIDYAPPMSARVAPPMRARRTFDPDSDDDDLSLFRPHSAGSDCTKLPAKASKLLGFEHQPNTPIPRPPSASGNPPRVSTARGRRNFFGSTNQLSPGCYGLPQPETPRPSTSSGVPSHAPSQPDNRQLKALRAELAQCIGRLVATLRLSATPSERAESSLKQEEDPLFMRTLCEVVRVTEES